MSDGAYAWDEQLALARRLAAAYHEGQRRRDGQPYVAHCRRVSETFGDPHAQCVGLLHDVVEDTEATIELLREQGVAEPVLNAVDCLTKLDGESYEAYLNRVCTHPVAMRVKIADMFDNVSDNPTLAQKDKYRAGLARILRVL